MNAARIFLLPLAAQWLFAAAPSIVELKPRGAERGRPFTLTFVGRDIPEGARVWSTMPASFTPVVSQSTDGMMMGAGRTAQFLVEPKSEIAPGVYPVRLESPQGISNILLFTVGTYPELTEQESLPYSQPHRNDTIENAESIGSTPITINGAVRGAERDIFRVYGKAGETRVFEIESRRCGSAVDPVLRILDTSGRQLARSDDALGNSLDPRISFKFPREGYYYVEVHDARFSNQAQNFYRLKMGAYSFADGLFPLGGRRGASTAVSFFGGNLTAPAKAQADLTSAPEGMRFTHVALPGSDALPFLFAVSDYPELIEPAGAIPVPSVINGRLGEPGRVNRYKFPVKPGDKLLFEVEARELGTSKLEAILTAYDAHGKKLDSAGDKPLPEDVFAVQASSRTSNDPFLNLTVPEGVHEITLAIEDLALRGGPEYAYRIVTRKAAEDFRLFTGTPHVNLPPGGTAFVSVAADRRGYDGPIRVTIPDLPKGIRVEGGYIPRETVDKNNTRSFNRRGALILSAEPGVELPPTSLEVIGEATLSDGTVLRRSAGGPAMAVAVAGATQQGSVDRQRSLTAPWLGLTLPVASTSRPDAELEVAQVKFTPMEEGARYDFKYQWKTRSKDIQLPNELAVDVVGVRDIRVTSFEKAGDGGTFAINITRAVDPATYDVVVRGRIRSGGDSEEIYARPLPLVVTERSANVQTATAQ